jgi:hypothetical protein
VRELAVFKSKKSVNKKGHSEGIGLNFLVCKETYTSVGKG